MSTTAKAHGMDGRLVEPDWPPLTLDEVRALLGAVSRTSASRSRFCRPARGRFLRPAWWRRRAGRVFIKRHHRTRPRSEGLLEEHRFMQHLRAHGAPVPRVFAAASGETAIEMRRMDV